MWSVWGDDVNALWPAGLSVSQSLLGGRRNFKATGKARFSDLFKALTLFTCFLSALQGQKEKQR